ncbi:MAG: TerB family tellurite resistance protein [Gemmatimonadota bacterium]|nr:TerB family tellurite resistance protein [Gemmatimonadota bacterium]
MVESLRQGALVHSMLKVMVADGVVDDTEVIAIQHVVGDLVGQVPDQATIRAEAERASAGDVDVVAALEDIAHALDTPQRGGVLRSVLRVALADGTYSPEEHGLIERIARALDLSD